MRLWYIPLADETKRPVAKFGGWPLDPDHDGIFASDEIDEIEHDNWAVAGSSSGTLLVVDVDMYKMSDEEQDRVEHGWMGLLDETRIVRTQSGGLHVYFQYEGDELPRPVEHVDIKGDVGKGYAVSSISPGYEIANDEEIREVSLETLTELPVFRDEDPRPIDSSSEGALTRTENITFEESTAIRMVPPCQNQARRVLGTHEDDDDFAEEMIVAYHRSKGHRDIVIQEVFNRYDDADRDIDPGTIGTDTLLVTDVLNGSYSTDTRVEHPNFLHSTPSDTESNFMVDAGAETFRCWRHDVTGNAFHLIGVKGGVIDCGDWETGLDKDTWLEIFQEAKDRGYDLEEAAISCEDIIEKGYCPYDCGRPFPHA